MSSYFLINGQASFAAGNTAPIYDDEYKAWRTDNGLLSDAGRVYAVSHTAPAPAAPTVAPDVFYFLWTMQEQVAIEQLRQSDPVVMLFMRRVDDPRTTEVVLATPTVQEAVRHTVAQLVVAGVIAADDAQARVAAILAGQSY